MGETGEAIIENLLSEFKEQRESLKTMIVDLEAVKGKIDNLFPEGTLDKRYSRFFEEKVKTATGIFGALLEIRKEITKSLKDEIELRRKLTKEDNDSKLNFESLLDIGNLASKIESLQNKKVKLVRNVDEKIKEGFEEESLINIKNVKIDDPLESLKLKMGM